LRYLQGSLEGQLCTLPWDAFAWAFLTLPFQFTTASLFIIILALGRRTRFFQVDPARRERMTTKKDHKKQEDDYFARMEFERRKKALEEQQEKMKSAEKEKL